MTSRVSPAGLPSCFARLGRLRRSWPMVFAPNATHGLVRLVMTSLDDGIVD